MNSDKAAPVACTLSVSEFKSRAQWLNKLTSKSLMAYRIEGLTAHLTYKPEAAEDVEQLVRLEQLCCGFVQFQVKHLGDCLEVRITVSAEAVKDARTLFAHLIPD